MRSRALVLFVLFFSVAQMQSSKKFRTSQSLWKAFGKTPAGIRPYIVRKPSSATNILKQPFRFRYGKRFYSSPQSSFIPLKPFASVTKTSSLFKIPWRSWFTQIPLKYKLIGGTAGLGILANSVINYYVPTHDQQVNNENFLRYVSSPVGREQLIKFAKDNPEKYLNFILAHWKRLLNPLPLPNPLYKDHAQFIADFIEEIVAAYNKPIQESIINSFIQKISEDFMLFNQNRNASEITEVMRPYFEQSPELLPKMCSIAINHAPEILDKHKNVDVLETLLKQENDNTIRLSKSEKKLSNWVIKHFSTIINRNALMFLRDIQTIPYLQKSFTNFLTNPSNIESFESLSKSPLGIEAISKNIQAIPAKNINLANRIINIIRTNRTLLHNPNLLNNILLRYIDIYHNFPILERPQQAFKQKAALELAKQIIRDMHTLDASSPEKSKLVDEGIATLFEIPSIADEFFSSLTELKAVEFIKNRPLFETFISNNTILKHNLLLPFSKHLDLFTQSTGITNEQADLIKNAQERISKKIQEHEKKELILGHKTKTSTLKGI